MELSDEQADGVAEACDLLMGNGVPEDQARVYVRACLRDGRDPQGWAEKFIHLRKSHAERSRTDDSEV